MVQRGGWTSPSKSNGIPPVETGLSTTDDSAMRVESQVVVLDRQPEQVIEAANTSSDPVLEAPWKGVWRPPPQKSGFFYPDCLLCGVRGISVVLNISSMGSLDPGLRYQ
ncbi:uncharacterized protein LOC133493889 isoform X4 [Syngnathoides biaculeatus]|uniref:uncharacterized protein LOC133493889 isoform X4 n=1 Tax=Syngnathoides biaculeatus TaxID=300417 RepID=UPI002ADDE460|nr:uncharacterized protein LOC133493889 isoform X4 [Syngnathoides biaculeatus]